MSKPYDHADDEFTLCSQFADPTKTCGTRWNNKTIVFDENTACMTDGQHTAYLINGVVTTSPPLDDATAEKWTDVMTKAINSMRTDTATRDESYLRRHINVGTLRPRWANKDYYFEYTDKPTTNVPPGRIYRVGSMLKHSDIAREGSIKVDNRGFLTYDDESGFHEEKTWTEAALSLFGRGSQ